MAVTLDEDIWYQVAQLIDPDPLVFAKLATVSKLFKNIFTSNAVWKRLNPYGVDGNVYAHFRETTSARDSEAMYKLWRGQYTPRLADGYDLFTNLYLYMSYLICTAQGATNEPETIGNRQLLLTCLDLDDYVYFMDRLTPGMYLDRDVAMAACCKHGCMLEYFPEYQNDKEIVLSAVDAGCLDEDRPLKHASDALKDDYDVVMTAVKRDGYSIELANDRLRSDKSIIEAAVQVEPSALSYAGVQERDMVIDCVQKCQLLLGLLDDELRDDEEIVIASVTADWHSIYGASDRLAQSKKILELMVKLHPECLDTLEKQTNNIYGEGGKIKEALKTYGLL